MEHQPTLELVQEAELIGHNKKHKMKKVVKNAEEAIAGIESGMTLMLGGF